MPGQRARAAVATPAGDAETGVTAGARSCYLYGIVPADTAAGMVESLPGQDLALVPHRRIAGLTRPVPDDPHQIRRQLLGYTEVLDRLAGAGAVLPVQFGTVLDDPAAVTRDVLSPHHDAFAHALDALAGTAQLVVRARYLVDGVVAEVLDEHPEARALHQRLHRQGGRDAGSRGRRARPDAGQQTGRVRLGELVAQAIAGKRASDLDTLAGVAGSYASAVRVEPSRAVDAERIGDVVCLVERARVDEFEAAVTRLGRHWQQRAVLRLLGPMAPYHFAGDVAALGGGS